MITITKQLLESQNWLNKKRNEPAKHTYFHNGHLNITISDKEEVVVRVFKDKDWLDVPFAKSLTDLFTLHKLFNGQDFIETPIRLSSGVPDVTGKMIKEGDVIDILSSKGSVVEDCRSMVYYKNGAFVTIAGQVTQTTLHNWMQMGCSFKIVEG